MIIDLLKWGLPLFFASPGVVVDGGAGDDAGGGDAGDVADTGDTGDDGATDTGDESTEDETGAEAGDAEAEEDSESAGTDASGRGTPDAIKKALNKLRETDPATASMLRKAFFKQEQALGSYRQAFANAADAVTARDLIESHGGEEGLSALATDAKTFATEITQLANGDPALIDELAKDKPEGLVKITPHVVAKMREINPQAYEKLAGGIIASTFRDKNFMSHVDRVMELIADGKQQAAYEKADAIRKWVNGVLQFASENKSANEPDPRDKEIRDREQTLEQREQAAFRGRVASAVTQRMNRTIEQHLAPYLKDALKSKRNLSLDQKKGLASGIYSRISGTLGKDSTYQSRLKALLSDGDIGKIERYVSSQVDRLVKAAVRAEWHSRGFAGGSPARRAAAGGNGSGPAGIVSKPAADTIDWSKDRDRMRYTGNGEFGEATLKNGKVVKFRH